MKTASRDSVLLMVVSAVLIWPLFQVEYFDNWMSIDGAFIGDARILSERLPRPGWVREFYSGNRYDYLYPPAMRYSSALLAKFAGFSPARAYHFYSALLYCVMAVGIYALVRAGTQSRGWAVAAGIASLFLSPALLFFKPIRDDSALHMPQRLNVIVKWGEVPHMSALALLLLAIGAAWIALRGDRPGWMATSALLCAASALTNFYGATALAILFAFLTWTTWVESRERAVWWRAAAIAGLSYGVTAFWLTPSYLALTAENLKLVSAPTSAWWRWLTLAFLVGFALISYRVGSLRPNRTWPLFLAGTAGLFALNAMGFYYLGVHALGDPKRFIPEFDLLLLVAALECLRRGGAAARVGGGALLAALLVLAAPYIRSPWGVYVNDEQPERRIEHRMSSWLAQNLPGSRIYSVGSVGFWANVWNDISWVGGISDQGMQNQTLALANWQILNSEKPGRDILWLQALGADAILLHGQRSQEIFHSIRNARKFHGHLPPLLETPEDDFIFRVPRRFPGLARVVDRSQAESLAPIGWHDENEPQLRAYVETLENGPNQPATSAWLDGRTLLIRARVEEGQSIAVQTTFDPCWEAYANELRLPIQKDVLGFLRIDVPAGTHEVRLHFATPLENEVGTWVTAATLAVLGYLWWRAFAPAIRRPRVS